MADVICVVCNERYHETTDKYDPRKSPNGTMFRLKDKYRDYGWSSFIEDESSIGENLCCPDCEGSYPEGPEGKVRVDKDQYIAELLEKLEGEPEETPAVDKVPCPYCGDLFAKKGLAVHIKAKHPEEG